MKVKIENEYRRFRAQFSESDWAKLESRIEFKEALAGDDLVRAGELADRILKGEAKSLPKAREIKKIHDLLGDYLD